MTRTAKRFTKLQTAGLVTAGLAAGGLLLGGVAHAAGSATTGSPSSSGTSSATPPANPVSGKGFSPGGSSPVRSDEKAVSSDVAAKLKAAALKEVPGATVIRVETDAGDAAYEAHITKADGGLATVKFDKNYAVVDVETGMGQGDPAPKGAPSGGPQGGTAPSTAPSTSSGSGSGA